jgi:predicted nucleic acid-binding Zn ribbon protein
MAGRRRCAHCRNLLPKDTGSRKKYCSPACVARAYRKRKSLKEKQFLSTTIIGEEAAAFLRGEHGRERRIGAWQHCPACGAIVWAGVRRRADAVYCSNACRSRAARARARNRAVGHDAEP